MSRKNRNPRARQLSAQLQRLLQAVPPTEAVTPVQLYALIAQGGASFGGGVSAVEFGLKTMAEGGWLVERPKGAFRRVAPPAAAPAKPPAPAPAPTATQAATPTPIPVNQGSVTVKHHSKAQLFELMTLIKGTYTTSGLNDEQFAEHAQVALKFPVSAAQVASSRRELSIKSNVKLASEKRAAERPVKAKPATAADVDALMAMITELSDRVAKLEATA